MRRIVFIALAVLSLSCTDELSSFDGTVETSVSLEETTKVALTGTDSALKSGRVWKWEEGDVLTYTYTLDGKEYDVQSSQAKIDEKNSSLLHVTLKGIPEQATFTKVVYGSPSVYGKTCIAEGSIPSTMVYACSLINSDPGDTNIPGVTLDHKCSYFLIYPDYVTVGTASYQIKDLEVTGFGMREEEKEEKLSITLYDSSTRTFKPIWLALNCNAKNIVFTADYGAGKAEMARIASAGGKCTLFDVSNRNIGTEYK